MLEPNYSNKYPPIGLMKISTYHKMLGYEVVFYKGDLKQFVIERIAENCVQELKEIDETVNWSLRKDKIIEFIASRKKDSYKTENTNMAIAFCDTVKAAGYKAGVYSGASFFVTYLNISKLSSYDIWVARYLYGSDTTFPFTTSGMPAINKCIGLGYTFNNKYTSIKADMWQYTSSGTVAGIPGRVCPAAGPGHH